MNIIHIKHELLLALHELNGQHFAVGDLTRIYLNRPERLHHSLKPARQFVYRNMLRMIKDGLLEKLDGKSRYPKYRFTEKFEAGIIKQAYDAKPTHDVRTEITEDRTARCKYTSLLERLNQHKADMLCAFGEAEEYDALCKERPEFRNEAQQMYNEARERNAILLGKIKAVEYLLSSSSAR